MSWEESLQIQKLHKNARLKTHLFDIVLGQSHRSDIDCILLHWFRHVGILYDGFSLLRHDGKSISNLSFVKLITSIFVQMRGRIKIEWKQQEKWKGEQLFHALSTRTTHPLVVFESDRRDDGPWKTLSSSPIVRVSHWAFRSDSWLRTLFFYNMVAILNDARIFPRFGRPWQY